MIKLLRSTIGPLCLISFCSPFVILMWYTNTALNGSFSQLFHHINDNGFFSTLYQIWQPVFWGSTIAWKMIFYFILFEFALIKILPGSRFYGPVTANGHRPVYKMNGLLAFIVTILFFSSGTFYFNLFPASIVYDHFGELISALNLFSFMVCIILYFKGRYAPSSNDSGLSGNFIFDFYWGTELYPVLWGANLKMFINCRLGMMSWGLILLSYAAKQNEVFGLSNSMVIAVVLQLIYITKFFIWESGYLTSLDIMYDRAGYYICWGCLVWVPCIYTSPTMYLVYHPNQLSMLLVVLLLVCGTLSILINYLADRQRQLVRNTAGLCKIWGKEPQTIQATYRTASGETKYNLLLCSGWWGIARHFHYLPEIAAAFFWSVPALFTHFSPYFYVCFLTILLLDRTFRDDLRCASKYGVHWDAYCHQVPYKLIPYVF